MSWHGIDIEFPFIYPHSSSSSVWVESIYFGLNRVCGFYFGRGYFWCCCCRWCFWFRCLPSRYSFYIFDWLDGKNKNKKYVKMKQRMRWRLTEIAHTNRHRSICCVHGIMTASARMQHACRKIPSMCTLCKRRPDESEMGAACIHNRRYVRFPCLSQFVCRNFFCFFFFAFVLFVGLRHFAFTLDQWVLTLYIFGHDQMRMWREKRACVALFIWFWFLCTFSHWFNCTFRFSPFPPSLLPPIYSGSPIWNS